METIQTNVNEAIASFGAIKEKIAETGVEVPEGTKARELANKVSEVYQAGKQAEYDEFWEEALKSGTNSWVGKFAGTCWTDKTFKPNKDLLPYGNSTNLFNNCLITNLTQILKDNNVMLNTSAITVFSSAFAYSKITAIPYLDLSVVTTINNCFNYSTQLVNIEGLKLNESCRVSSAFDSCTSLEKVIFEGTIGQNGFDIHWSTKLSAASLESIINALSTTTTGLTITLPSTAEANYDAVKGAGAWTALTATRSNWTIAYA